MAVLAEQDQRRAAGAAQRERDVGAPGHPEAIQVDDVDPRSRDRAAPSLEVPERQPGCGVVGPRDGGLQVVALPPRALIGGGDEE